MKVPANARSDWVSDRLVKEIQQSTLGPQLRKLHRLDEEWLRADSDNRLLPLFIFFSVWALVAFFLPRGESWEPSALIGLIFAGVCSQGVKHLVCPGFAREMDENRQEVYHLIHTDEYYCQAFEILRSIYTADPNYNPTLT